MPRGGVEWGAVNEDPEQARALELARLVGRQAAGDPEREELALLLQDRADLRPLVEAETRRTALGSGWLDRVEADERLQRAEATPAVRVERGAGLGLLALGFAVTPFVPVLGGPAMMLGSGVLLWSFVRVKLKTLKDDPYRKVNR